ncbi:unnamed protein product [Adineta steineri]|uniref:F-box domain-containing protein n=1 Tax=Adineta steineri TaxID=433720 RepID=A0A814WQM2_9BILA|nr:unnamed protein product [Adineta steineri]
MSDISVSVQLRLEVLPDELFLEIFQYLDPVDLRSFKGLNRRIDCVIQATKVNVVVQSQKQNDLDYLLSLVPTQIIRLELRGSWSPLSLSTMTELRSLTLDCASLSRRQLCQIVKINLPNLKRLAVENIEYHPGEHSVQAIFNGERFPSLKICQLEFNDVADLKLIHNESLRNNVLRSLVLNKCNWAEFGTLLHQLTNLRRLETSFKEPGLTMVNVAQPHLSIHHLKVTLQDPLDDLKKILKSTPNLTRLRIRGKLGRKDVPDYFKEMARFLPTLTSRLQHFDCELYCISSSSHGKESVIRQFHPLFKSVQCLFGRGDNRCYATDITIYPTNNEYEESLPLNSSFMRSSSNHWDPYHYYSNEDDEDAYDYAADEYSAWERNEYGNGPDMYWDAESDEWCPLP